MAATAKKPKVDRAAIGSVPREWSWFANGPLKGVLLMRERQWIVAWDDSNTLYALDLYGELISQHQAQKEIIGVSAADNGDAVVAIGRSGQVWWFDGDLELRFEHEAPFDPLAVAVDHFGYYAVVSSREGRVLVLGRDGKRRVDFETRPPLRYMAFVAADGNFIGASEHGMIGCYDVQGRTYWNTSLSANVAGLAVDGDGEVLLTACFARGLIRFGADGAKEGTYRMESAPSLVTVDYAGRTILTASLEQTLTELTYEGTIVASRSLPDKPVALALDPLARYFILGLQRGEVRFHTVDGFLHDSAPALGAAPAAAGPTEIVPAWESRGADSLEEANSAVLEPVPGTNHVALYTSRRTIRVFDGDGKVVHETTGVTGVGRSLRASKNWLLAATDTQMLAYDPADGTSVNATMPMYEISHVEPCEAFGELILVQSCEHVCRMTFPENEHWRQQFDQKVESAAVLPDGRSAFALDDRTVRIYAADGKPLGRYKSQPPEALVVAAGDDGWLTLARDARILRGHEPDGKLMWSVSLPWTPWSILPLGRYVVANSIDGASLLVTLDGEVLAESREGRQHARYFLSKDAAVMRAYQSDQTLAVAEFGGRIVWRFTAEQRLGPFAVGEAGVWAMLGRTLSFFPLPAKETR